MTEEIPKQACLVKILNQVQNDICGVRDDERGEIPKQVRDDNQYDNEYEIQ
jgi:hypothetical protein